MPDAAIGIGAALCACAASHTASLGAPSAALALAPRSVASACSGASVRALALRVAELSSFLVPGCFYDPATGVEIISSSSSAARHRTAWLGVRPVTPSSPRGRVVPAVSAAPICVSTPVAGSSAGVGSFFVVSRAAASIISFITLGGISVSRTFPRPGSSEALSIDPGAAARDGRAAAIDQRRDLLDMT